MWTLVRELEGYRRRQICRRVTASWSFATAFIVLTLASVYRAKSDDWIHGGLTQAVWTAPLGQFEREPGVGSAVILATAEATGRVLGPRIQDEENAPQIDQSRESTIGDADGARGSSLQPLPSWLNGVHVGYDSGFVIASGLNPDIDTSEAPFLLRLNGLGQLRHTRFDSQSENPDLNQFQLIRGRLIFSGNALTPNFRYFVQLDGRSSAGDEFRLLDYFMEFDLGRQWWDLNRNALVFKAGRYKVPFTFARFLSAREL